MPCRLHLLLSLYKSTRHNLCYVEYHMTLIININFISVGFLRKEFGSPFVVEYISWCLFDVDAWQYGMVMYSECWLLASSSCWSHYQPSESVLLRIGWLDRQQTFQPISTTLCPASVWTAPHEPLSLWSDHGLCSVQLLSVCPVFQGVQSIWSPVPLFGIDVVLLPSNVGISTTFG